MLTRRQGLAAAGAAAWATRARAAAPEVTVAIQYGVGYLPVMIADKLGLFAKHAQAAGTPATLKLVRMSGATAVNDALISGSIDVGAYGLPGMLIARERTLRSYGIKGLASLSASPFRMYTNKPGIASVSDIGPGDRIAVTAPNTPQAELVRMAAEKALGDAHKLDAQMVSLPHPDATAALISANTVTLYMSTEPFSTTLAKQPGIHLVTDSRAIMGEPLTSGMLAAPARFMDPPARGAALVEALAEADKLIQSDPKQAAAIYLQSEQTRLSADELTDLLRTTGTNYDVQPSGTVSMAAFMLKQGELKQPLARWQDAWFAPVSQNTGS